MTLAQILAALSQRKGRVVRSSDYPSLRAMLADWRAGEAGHRKNPPAGEG